MGDRHAPRKNRMSKERKELATDLKTIYVANTEEEAYSNLQELKEKWRPRKVLLDNWENNWENVSTFFKYSPAIRKNYLHNKFYRKFK